MKNPSASAVEEDHIAAEARSWLELLFAGEPTDADRVRFEAWLSHSSAHRTAFEKAERVWSLLGVSDRVADWVSEPISTRNPRPRRRWLIWAAAGGIAAVAALAVVGGPFVLEAVKPIEPKRYVAGIGQTKTVDLEDGTVVTLGASTTVEVIYSHRARKINLTRGSAFFDVAPEQSRPLTVDASRTEIRVLGTAFGVRYGPNNVSVSVTRGSVAVGTDKKDRTSVPEPELTISAGKRVVADLAGHILSASDADLAVDLSWMEDRLVYDGTSLADVVSDINRYRAKRVEIAGAGVADLRITTSFRPDQAQQFLVSLPAAYPVTLRDLPDRTLIEAKGR